MSGQDRKGLEKVIGCRIKTLRKAAGLSQEELSEKAEIAPQFLSRLENARHVPSVETILALAKALNTNPCAILGEPGQNSQAECANRIAALLDLLTEEDAEFLESQISGWVLRLKKRK